MKYRILSKQSIIMLISILCFSLITIYIFNKEKLEAPKVLQKSEKIDQFINSLNQDIVNNIDINKEISSILIKDNNMYKSYIFDYYTGEELSIKDVIKDMKSFNSKVKELLYYKYPKIIADKLLSNNNNVYSLEETKLVIYFYDEDYSQLTDLYLDIYYKDIKDYLTFSPLIEENYSYENGFDIKSTDKLIAITFDDGPSNYTEELSEILIDNKAHSTFFFVGNRLNNTNAVLKVYNQGHEIGYHSYKHANFKRQKIEDIINEYNMSNEKIKSIIGQDFVLTRPPYGSINKKVKESLDTSFILWNVDTNDWRYKDVDYLVDYVLTNAKDGDIILFHDSYQTSIDAIKKLLPELFIRGFKVVTVSDLAKYKNKTIEKNTIYYSFK